MCWNVTQLTHSFNSWLLDRASVGILHDGACLNSFSHLQEMVPLKAPFSAARETTSTYHKRLSGLDI